MPALPSFSMILWIAPTRSPPWIRKAVFFPLTRKAAFFIAFWNAAAFVGTKSICAFLPFGKPVNATRFTLASRRTLRTRAPSPGLFGVSSLKYSAFVIRSAISFLLPERRLPKNLEAFLHDAVERPLRVGPVQAGLPRWNPQQDFDPFLDVVDGMDMEFFLPDRRDDVFLQHQVPHVPFRDDDPLRTVESPETAEIEEPLDLLVPPADRLHVPPLVHGPRDGDALPDGEARDRAQERIELRAGRAVPLDHAVQLLEGDRRRKADRLSASVPAPQVVREDENGFFMDLPGKLRLPLDVENPPLPGIDGRRDP